MRAFIRLVSITLIAAAPRLAVSQIEMAPAPGQPNISGLYRNAREFGGGDTLTVEGEEPPFRPEAKALYESRIALEQTEAPWADSEVYCLTAGMPRLSLSIPPYPFEILQAPGKVVFIFEALNIVRYIHLDRGHPDFLEKTWHGDSVGQWEGDTLVVDTVSINGKSTINKRGMPMSDAMHVTERIRLVDENTVENLITIDDSKTFTRPWTTRVLYRRQPPETEIREYVCEDNRTVMDASGRASYDFGPSPAP